METNNKSKVMHKIFLARAKQEKNGCINCGEKIIGSYYRKKSKEYLCNCLQVVSPMSGTPMHKSHIPPEVWFSLIKDIAKHKEGIDIKHIESNYKLSNTSAWNILYKIKDWINLIEEKENCIPKSKFIKVPDKLRERFVFKYNLGIPPFLLEQKMLESLPPLFEHLRENKMVA